MRAIHCTGNGIERMGENGGGSSWFNFLFDFATVCASLFCAVTPLSWKTLIGGFLGNEIECCGREGGGGSGSNPNFRRAQPLKITGARGGDFRRPRGAVLLGDEEAGLILLDLLVVGAHGLRDPRLRHPDPNDPDPCDQRAPMTEPPSSGGGGGSKVWISRPGAHRGTITMPGKMQPGARYAFLIFFRPQIKISVSDFSLMYFITCIFYDNEGFLDVHTAGKTRLGDFWETYRCGKNRSPAAGIKRAPRPASRAAPRGGSPHQGVNSKSGTEPSCVRKPAESACPEHTACTWRGPNNRMPRCSPKYLIFFAFAQIRIKNRKRGLIRHLQFIVCERRGAGVELLNVDVPEGVLGAELVDLAGRLIPGGGGEPTIGDWRSWLTIHTTNLL